jgi:flagellar protein FlbT
MALKVELKPGERIILGQSVITNGDSRSTLAVEGDEPILREKDILRTTEADTPCKRIYLVVQLMYLARDPSIHRPSYEIFMADVAAAAPSMVPRIERVNQLVSKGAYYRALKETKAMIAYEGELIANAQRR